MTYCDTVEEIPLIALPGNCIRRLDFHFYNLEVKKVELLVEVLASPHSRVVDLSLENLGKEAIKCLSEGLITACNSSSPVRLKDLRLFGGRIGVEEIQYLVKFITSPGNGLLSLLISKNDMGSEEIEQLARALTSPHNRIKSLSLEDNHIGTDGCYYLFKTFKSRYNRLTRLDLDNCGITDVGVYYLSVALISTYNCLTILILSCNSSISEIGLRTLSLYISEPNHLSDLRLWGNNVNDEGVRCIAESLQSPHNHLTSLDLSCNCQITSKGIKYLAEALQSPYNHLTSLNLWGTGGLDKDGLGYLAESLRSPNNCLTRLDISASKERREIVRLMTIRDYNRQILELTLQATCWRLIRRQKLDVSLIPPIIVYINDRYKNEILGWRLS